MRITKIEAASLTVSRWNGGTTTQLAIAPPDAVYADREFLWRLSSAVVELPESDFTLLPDYDRILMILDGELSLSHNGGEEYVLRPLEQTSFDGGWHTFSRGQVTDFNLMMRKGLCTGRVEGRVLRRETGWTDAVLEDYEEHLVYCVDGEAEIKCGEESWALAKGDALLIEGSCQGLCGLRGEGVIVLAEMKKI